MKYEESVRNVATAFTVYGANQWEEDDEVVLSTIEFVLDTLMENKLIPDSLKEDITKLLEKEQEDGFC